MTSNLYDEVLPRYFRIRNDNNKDVISFLNSVYNESHVVPWMNNFCAIAGTNKLGDKNIRNQILNMNLFPMDISSEIPVKALELENLIKEKEKEKNESSIKVLDLCCSPGGKYLSIYDKLRPQDKLDGVDISDQRLNVCKSLLSKYIHLKKKKIIIIIMIIMMMMMMTI